MVGCDNLVINRVGYTYRQEKLQQYSLSDHLFICNNDLQLVKYYSIIDIGTNLSDYYAINAALVLNATNIINDVKQVSWSKIVWTPRNV